MEVYGIDFLVVFLLARCHIFSCCVEIPPATPFCNFDTGRVEKIQFIVVKSSENILYQQRRTIL